MDKTAALLEQLAQKLGTTVEYLWAILLKQAPISATTNLICILFTVVVYIAAFKRHKKVMAMKVKGPYDTVEGSGYVKDSNVAIGIISVIAVVTLTAGCIVEFIPNVLSGYLNPEYWALHKVLEKIK